jgi:prepilin-type N-terminal cleavage/methylation domain-containing protein
MREFCINRPEGVTLVELMVSIAVLSALLGLGVPSFVGFIQDHRISAATTQVVSTLNFARSEASSRSSVVTIERLSAIDRDWSLGWDIYTDADVLGNTTRVEADTFLRQISEDADGVSVSGNGAATRWVSYRPNGMLNESGNTVVFAVCDERGELSGRDVVVSLSGRVRVVEPSDDCTP